MDDPIIVLVTKGKHESVDYASVHLFDNNKEAKDFIKSTRTGPQKHWTEAEMMVDGFEVELMQPED